MSSGTQSGVVPFTWLRAVAIVASGLGLIVFIWLVGSSPFGDGITMLAPVAVLIAVVRQHRATQQRSQRSATGEQESRSRRRPM